MKCLNCGQPVHAQEENCTSCNIPLSYYGLLQEVSSSPVESKKIEGSCCPNCNGMQSDPEAYNCEYCNFPLDNHNNSKEKKSSTESVQGFAWRNVGQNRFSMNYDRSMEKDFFKPTLKLSF